MSTITTTRGRAPLALVTALALIAAMFSMGIGPASAAVTDWATVTDHAPGGSSANHPGFWCPAGTVGLKAPDDYPYSSFGSLSSDGRTFTLGNDANPGAAGNQAFAMVIVKAGADQSTDGNVNTVFAEPPVAGQTVWADSNPDDTFGEGDKQISHIIFCGERTAPQGSLKAVKQWKVTGLSGDYSPGTPGTLTFNDVTKDWATSYEYPAGTDVTVAEAADGTPPSATGYTCTIDNQATTYTVGQDTSTTPPTVRVTTDTTVQVTITNTANCTKDEVLPGSLKAVKQWKVTGLSGDYSPGTPGTLTFNDVTKDWATSYEYPAGTDVTVAEAADGTPPSATGYTCTIDNQATTYTVGQDTSTTPPTVRVTTDTTVQVTITNTANCTRVLTAPKKGSVEALKEWTITGLDPQTAPGFTSGTPGTLTFNDVVKPWMSNTTTYEEGTKVTVKEAGNGTPPSATGYTCTIDTGATTYTVGESTDSTPPIVTVKGNTTVKVTVTNKANCTKDIPPPPATTTLTVTKVWVPVGTPPGYSLTSANAGALNVSVGGTPTGQAWGAVKADLKVGDKATVSEAPVPAPPAYTGYTCSVTGSPEYAVNGGGFTTTAASFPLAPGSNTVTVRNTVTCVADSAVGGTEDDDTDTPTVDDSGSTDDEQVVAGSEDELASTGANTGPAGLGLLLILSGAAFVTARRLALK